MKFWITLFSFLTFTLLSWSQTACDLSVNINVEDTYTGKALSDATIYYGSQESTTDSLGQTYLRNMCPGSYHFIIYHPFCDAYEYFIELDRDTTITIKLQHQHNDLKAAHVQANSINVNDNISKKEITQEANKNLGQLLENIQGISILSTGTNISKPVVGGYYGNRVDILVDGVAIAGQQWGNDHSPEVDPMLAQNIQLLDEVNALCYQGSGLGSSVLITPNKIDKDPHLHGNSSLYYQSNGKGYGIYTNLHSYNKIGWQVQGSYKANGDRCAPDYFLTNTGSQNLNLSFQLEKDLSQKWNSRVFGSYYSSKLGILRGSQIGNLSDLQEAFRRDTPFYTSDDFSYSIQPPKQDVKHYALNWKNHYHYDENRSLEIGLNQQLDKRREFDNRRGGRSTIPSLDLLQYSFLGEAKYKKRVSDDKILNYGFQYNFIQNKNEPGTGILPLIPNYVSYQASLYANRQKVWDKLLWKYTFRFSYLYRNSIVISHQLPHDISSYRKSYLTGALASSIDYITDSHWEFNALASIAMRPPAVNELYSAGLHQGVGGLEYGDPNLKTETALELKVRASKHFEKFYLYTQLYAQNILNYIYLYPTGDYALTIRGAFPVFKYTQTHAVIYGADLNAHFEIFKNVKLELLGNYLYGQDRTKAIPLVYMPPPSISSHLILDIPTGEKWKDTQLKLLYKYQFKQNHLLARQDYLAPPPAYSLVGIKMETTHIRNDHALNLFAEVNNLLNTSYRDYMNRQRYFADELGRNILIGLNYNY